MKKPDSLRTHILAAVKELQRDPERMLIFTDKVPLPVLLFLMQKSNLHWFEYLIKA